MGRRSTHRVDANQRDIAEGLRKAGRSVFIVASVGDGCPDLIVGFISKRSGQSGNILLEVKRKGGTLTPDQVKFKATWIGPWAIVETVDEALKATE